MKTPRISRSALAAGAATLGALGAIGVAQLAGASNPVMQFTQAQSSPDATTATTTPASDAPDAEPARCHRAPLDAETEAKVKAAAEAAVEGSTYRHGHKNHDADGYKALVSKADGTKVLVHMDNAFKVTKVEDPAPARGERGPGDRTPLDAETDAKVKAASEAAVEGATYRHGHKDRDGSGYSAMLTKTDGTRVLVHLDNEFKVTQVQDPAPMRGPGPGGRGHGGPHRDGEAPASTEGANAA